MLGQHHDNTTALGDPSEKTRGQGAYVTVIIDISFKNPLIITIITYKLVAYDTSIYIYDLKYDYPLYPACIDDFPKGHIPFADDCPNYIP